MKPSSSRMRERKFIDLLRKTKWSKWAHRFSVTPQCRWKSGCQDDNLILTVTKSVGQSGPLKKPDELSIWDSLPGARVQRCGSPVATSKGRRHFEAPTEPTGETAALWRESRGNALPSDMMLCVISYWVLSGAKRRQIQQLRCCVFPRQAKEMFIVTIDGIFLLFKNILKQPCIKSACVI